MDTRATSSDPGECHPSSEELGRGAMLTEAASLALPVRRVPRPRRPLQPAPAGPHKMQGLGVRFWERNGSGQAPSGAVSCGQPLAATVADLRRRVWPARSTNACLVRDEVLAERHVPGRRRGSGPGRGGVG